MRADAEAVLRAAVAAADPAAAVRGALRLDGDTLEIAGTERIALGRGRVWIVGAGKATPRMAAAALEVLGRRVAGGTIATRHGQALPLPPLDVWEAGHPLPDAHSVAAAAEALRLVRGAAADDLVLCLLSGGASAVWAAPQPGLTLGALRGTTQALLRSGAPIGAVNVVRRHIQRLGGGRLAAATVARVATLAVSDVVGGAPAAVGSGPTVAEPATPAEALEALRRHDVEVPPLVRAHLQAAAAVGDAGGVAEAGRRAASFHLIADVRLALDGAVREAERLGYAATIADAALEGEARGAGARIADIARAARDPAAPRALLWGGETTVTVRGDGRGGRCQELALAAAVRIAGDDGIVLGALATDGVDGPTDAAGAIVDGGTVGRAGAVGLDAADHLRRNDAYPFLDAAGDVLRTGPTGTNVNDVVVALTG